MNADDTETKPLLDAVSFEDWTSDLDIDVVLGILARVPSECTNCIADIRKAAAAGDLVTAKKAAHKLKGMAGNIGAARLAQLARGIELRAQTTDEILHAVAALEATLAETLPRMDEKARQAAAPSEAGE